MQFFNAIMQPNIFWRAKMNTTHTTRKVQFTETVLRDANQSLIATRLPYSKFADILPTMDKAGYYSVECLIN